MVNFTHVCLVAKGKVWTRGPLYDTVNSGITLLYSIYKNYVP